MLKTDMSTNSPPQCWGKHFSKEATECVGGIDAAYTDEHGRHIRPSCDYQESCSAKTQAMKLIPTTALDRRIQPPYQPPQQPQPYQVRTWQSHLPPPQVYQGQPHHQPHQLIPTYAMPQYLTVREPSNKPRGKRFLVEVLRAMGKSFGHTIANFFDFEAFTESQQPPPPPMRQDPNERK